MRPRKLDRSSIWTTILEDDKKQEEATVRPRKLDRSSIWTTILEDDK